VVTTFANTAPADLRAEFQTAATTTPVTITPTLLFATPPNAPMPSAADINIVQPPGQNITGTTPVTVAAGANPPLLFTLTRSADPAKGTASVDRVTGLVTYTPRANFTGDDVLEVTVTDGNTPPLAGAVRIPVHVSAAPPTALTLTTNPTSPIPLISGAQAIQINFTPQTGGPREFSASNGPSKGTVRFEGDSGRLIYTPNPGVSGADSFVVTLTIFNNANDRVIIATGSTTIAITQVSGSSGGTQQ